LEDLARALEEMFAAARTALPELIAEVERLRAENRVLKQEINAEALYHDLPERYPLEGDR
jgi:SHS2 domain-containing protein